MIIPKEIERSASGHFLLDLHTDYLQRIYEVVHEIDPVKILLKAEDISKWDVGIKDQSEITREVRASKATEDMGKKDEERDKIITSLFQDIRNAAQSPIAERCDAGRTLKLIVDVYKGLQKERWAGKTVHTKGLLDDLAKPEAAAAVTALHLTEIVNLLRTTNDAFRKLRESRTTKSADTILPKSEEIRVQNDKMTSYIFQHIEAAYITAANDEDRKAIGQLIDQINARIRESKATHNKSQAQKKAAAEKKKKNPNAPKTPKEPKPKKPKKNDEPDVHLPEEGEPKKPGAGGEGKKPDSGGGASGGEGKKPDSSGGAGTGGGGKSGDDGDPDIHLPEE